MSGGRKLVVDIRPTCHCFRAGGLLIEERGLLVISKHPDVSLLPIVERRERLTETQGEGGGGGGWPLAPSGWADDGGR